MWGGSEVPAQGVCWGEIVRTGSWCSSEVIRAPWSRWQCFQKQVCVCCFRGTKSRPSAFSSGDRALSGLQLSWAELAPHPPPQVGKWWLCCVGAQGQGPLTEARMAVGVGEPGERGGVPTPCLGSSRDRGGAGGAALWLWAGRACEDGRAAVRLGEGAQPSGPCCPRVRATCMSELPGHRSPGRGHMAAADGTVPRCVCLCRGARFLLRAAPVPTSHRRCLKERPHLYSKFLAVLGAGTISCLSNLEI